MLATVRHQHILSTLRDRGTVSATILRNTLGVTSMTIWRDLKALEELGLLRRVHGGARILGTVSGEPDYEAKNRKSQEAKQRIAAFAVRQFVSEGDIIALEGGTTATAVVDHLPLTRISILTNSLPVALYIRSARPELPIQMAGGWLSRVSGNTTGSEALRFMERWRASVCFLSAAAFDREIGPSDPNPLEIEAKRMLASCARRVVMLLDASKFETRSNAVTLHPRRLHALVSDAAAPRGIRTLLGNHKVRFYHAPAITMSR